MGIQSQLQGVNRGDLALALVSTLDPRAALEELFELFSVANPLRCEEPHTGCELEEWSQDEWSGSKKELRSEEVKAGMR